MTDVIVPIKDLGDAKSRLSGILSPCERAGLVLAMLEDVLLAISETKEHYLWVVASDEEVFKLARRFGAQTLREDHACGYNAAVRLGFAAVAPRCPVAILPGDVPLMTSDDIRLLIEPAAQMPTVRLAPSRERYGTNGLFMTSKELLRPAFGPNSFDAYLSAAMKTGVRTEVLELPGLAHDIDVPLDLADFRSICTRGAARDFLLSGQWRSKSLNLTSETAARMR